MTRDGYGCFYAIPADQVVICMTSFTGSQVTDADAFWENIKRALVAVRDIAATAPETP